MLISTPPPLTMNTPDCPAALVVPSSVRALLALARSLPLITINPALLLDVPLMVTAPLVVAPPSMRVARSAVLVPSPQTVRVEPVAALKVTPAPEISALLPPAVLMPLTRLAPLLAVEEMLLPALSKTP